MFIGLSLFVIYRLAWTLYPVFVPAAPGIAHESLLSPFYSPLFFALDHGNYHAIFRTFPDG